MKLGKKEIPDRPTGPFVCPPGGQETIYYLRVTLWRNMPPYTHERRRTSRSVRLMCYFQFFHSMTSEFKRRTDYRVPYVF